MKKPVPNHIKAATAAIRPAPMPALFMSGWKPPPSGEFPPPPPPPAPLFAGRPRAFLLPPNKPLSLRLKSRHNSSKSGGPWLAPLGLGRGSGGGDGASGSGFCSPSVGLSAGGLSPSRPQRLSFRLNMPRARCFNRFNRVGQSAKLFSAEFRFMRSCSFFNTSTLCLIRMVV